MPVLRDQAVVLRLADYSESSQIATVFAREHGLLRVIAKGARKGTKQRFAPGLDLLECGDLQFAPAKGDATLGTLTDWTQRETFPGLRREMVRLYGALYAAELVVMLTEPEDPHPGLFDKLLAFLTHLASDAPPTPLIARFQWRLLEAIGLAPNLKTCVDTGQPPEDPQHLFFSTQAGGLVSRESEGHYVEKRRLSAQLLHTAPGLGDAYAWFELLDYHLRMLAGRPARSAAMLDQALRRTRGR